VRRLTVKPSFLIAKGGITSHDTAQKGLSIATARVLGQVEPGVPVWRAGRESKFPGMNYVVFPGNVGDDDALFRVAVKFGVEPLTPPTSSSSANTANSSDTTSTSSSTSTPSSSSVTASSITTTSSSSRPSLLSELTKARSFGYAVAAFNVCK
jgi:hypothetical protein